MSTPAGIQLEIVTPERATFSGNVSEVTLPGAAGEMGVLPGHIPLMTLLDPGEVRFNEGGTDRLFFVGKGLAEIGHHEVRVLVSACEGAGGIDVERARRALRDAESQLEKRVSLSDDEIVEQSERLERARARLAVVDHATKSRGGA